MASTEVTQPSQLLAPAGLGKRTRANESAGEKNSDSVSWKDRQEMLGKVLEDGPLPQLLRLPICLLLFPQNHMATCLTSSGPNPFMKAFKCQLIVWNHWMWKELNWLYYRQHAARKRLTYGKMASPFSKDEFGMIPTVDNPDGYHLKSREACYWRSIEYSFGIGSEIEWPSRNGNTQCGQCNDLFVQKELLQK